MSLQESENDDQHTQHAKQEKRKKSVNSGKHGRQLAQYKVLSRKMSENSFHVGKLWTICRPFLPRMADMQCHLTTSEIMEESLEIQAKL